jgi:mRNA-degrading endonuclease toxin of MazEF toxin-antitoxin module
MQKDFDIWNTKKKIIHNSDRVLFAHTREIWWCSLGVNIGSEQDGSPEDYRRPVVILKSLGQETCLIIPLTTSTRSHRLRIPIGEVQGKEAVALMSQLRVIDTKRLVKKVGYLNKGTFEILRKAARDML